MIAINTHFPSALVEDDACLDAALAEVLMPVILYSTLRMVWSLAQVGTARKSMSSFFIAALLHKNKYTDSISDTY